VIVAERQHRRNRVTEGETHLQAILLTRTSVDTGERRRSELNASGGVTVKVSRDVLDSAVLLGESARS
jgi:hypothetical protein